MIRTRENAVFKTDKCWVAMYRLYLLDRKWRMLAKKTWPFPHLCNGGNAE